MTGYRAWALVAVVLALPSCAGAGGMLSLSAEETDIRSCADTDPVAVETLDSAGRPVCDLLGSDLVFPDGTSLHTDALSASGSKTDSWSGRSYAFVGVGIYGVVASTYHGDCIDLEVWGRQEAIDKVVDAFGDNLGNC